MICYRFWAVDKLCKIFIGYQFFKFFSYMYHELAELDTENIYASIFNPLGNSAIES